MKTQEYIIKAIPAGSAYSLKNDGKLEVVPIGVGSMLSRKNWNTNFLIVKGETHLLIDFGRTGPEALAAIGVPIASIVNVLPTHTHDDHIGGIGTLAIANRYITRLMQSGAPKINIIAPKSFAGELWSALSGNLSINDPSTMDGDENFSKWFDLTSPEMISDPLMEYRETYFVEFGGLELQIFRTMHVPGDASSWRDSSWSTGVLIDHKVLITGDTRFDEEMIATYSPQAKVIFHDTALFNDPVHASIDSLRKLPSEVKEKMHLVHYGDNWVEHSDDGFAGWAKQGARYVID